MDADPPIFIDVSLFKKWFYGAFQTRLLQEQKINKTIMKNWGEYKKYETDQS